MSRPTRFGYVERIVGRSVIGWAVDSLAGGHPASLFLFIDGKAVANFRCDAERPDIEGADQKALKAGFHVVIPDIFIDGREHAAAVRFNTGEFLHVLSRRSEHSTDTALGFRLDERTLNSPFDGWVDSADRNFIRGWCWRRGSIERLTVHLIVNGTRRSEVVAGELRADLAAFGIGDGFYGFAIPITGLDLADDARIAVAVADEDHVLGLQAETLGELRTLSGTAGSSDLSATDGQKSAASIMRSFESLGFNCEFGLVQRHFGVEQKSLLQWGSVIGGWPHLVGCLQNRLAGAGEHVSYLLHGGEYVTLDDTHHIVFHTDKLVGSIDPSILIRNEKARIGYLARNLLENIETASKIFVYKQSRTNSVSEVEKILSALHTIGPACLLWVTEAPGDRRVGQVETLAPKLLRGYIDRFSPDEDIQAFCSFDVWLEICTDALRVVAGRV